MKGLSESVFVEIAGWEHVVKRLPDGRFTVWHHITPADGGYGTEVFLELPKDYFSDHSLDDFCKLVASEHRCVGPGKPNEREILRFDFHNKGWID